MQRKRETDLAVEWTFENCDRRTYVNSRQVSSEVRLQPQGFRLKILQGEQSLMLWDEHQHAWSFFWEWSGFYWLRQLLMDWRLVATKIKLDKKIDIAQTIARDEFREGLCCEIEHCERQAGAHGIYQACRTMAGIGFGQRKRDFRAGFGTK